MEDDGDTNWEGLSQAANLINESMRWAETSEGGGFWGEVVSRLERMVEHRDLQVNSPAEIHEPNLGITMSGSDQISGEPSVVQEVAEKVAKFRKEMEDANQPSASSREELTRSKLFK